MALTLEEIERRLNVVEDSVKELFGKANQTELNLVTVTTTLNSVMEKIGELKASVESLKSRPATLWDKLISALIGAAVTGFVTYLLMKP